jgi:hypothetical protein
MGETTMRAVTRLNVDGKQIEEATGALRRVVAAA